jgi:hypothetical protein
VRVAVGENRLGLWQRRRHDRPHLDYGCRLVPDERTIRHHQQENDEYAQASSPRLHQLNKQRITCRIPRG